MRATFVFLLLPVLLSPDRPRDTVQPQIEIAGDDRVVPGLAPDRPLVEPHLAAHPTDPRHLLGGAIVTDAAASFAPTQACVSFVTFDAGRTWASHTFDLQTCGDPWVALGADGDAWFSALGRRGTAAGNRLYLFRSTDGGRTWTEPPLDLGTGHDHQTLVVGPATSAERGMVYVLSGLGRKEGVATFHVYVARSEDRGRTWLPPIVLTASNLNYNTLAGGRLADGTLLVPFVDLQRPPFSGPGGMLAKRRVWTYLLRPDATATPPVFVSEDCAAASGFPSVVTVPKSSRGILLCVGTPAQGILVQASDGGVLWSAPVSVNPPADAAVQRTPSAAANADGVIAVTWMDSRGLGADCYQLRAAVSSDGGGTFGPSRVLSSAASCTQTEKNGAAAKRWKSGGDYSGLAATSDGRFHALWADARAGQFQLRFVTFGSALH